MLKHFAPALAVTAVLAISSLVYGADAASAPQNWTSANWRMASANLATTAPASSDQATAAKPKKLKLHHVAKAKKTRTTRSTLAAKDKAAAPVKTPAPALSDSTTTKTN